MLWSLTTTPRLGTCWWYWKIVAVASWVLTFDWGWPQNSGCVQEVLHKQAVNLELEGEYQQHHKARTAGAKGIGYPQTTKQEQQAPQVQGISDLKPEHPFEARHNSAQTHEHGFPFAGGCTAHSKSGLRWQLDSFTGGGGNPRRELTSAIWGVGAHCCVLHTKHWKGH